MVDPRSRQTEAIAEAEEAVLELGWRERRAGRVGVEGDQQPAGSAVPRALSGQGFEGGDVREARVLRVVEQPVKRSSLECGGEVEDRAGGRGDRDAFLRRGLLRSQRPGAVQATSRRERPPSLGTVTSTRLAAGLAFRRLLATPRP